MRSTTDQALVTQRRTFRVGRQSKNDADDLKRVRELTHVDSNGSAKMVDVSDKRVTFRSATAIGNIFFSNPSVSDLITNNSIKKGDVVSVARIAGIMAVKSTPNIIPLCHPLMVTSIKNDVQVHESSVSVECTVKCTGNTGVEMEAIVGAMATLVTVYDMCKAVDKKMVIGGVKVVEKKGGKSDFILDND